MILEWFGRRMGSELESKNYSGRVAAHTVIMSAFPPEAETAWRVFCGGAALGVIYDRLFS